MITARGVIQVVVATVGPRLGVLGTATYTIVILVAIATSVMAPPILRIAMRRVERTAEEDLRERALAGFRQASSAWEQFSIDVRRYRGCGECLHRFTTCLKLANRRPAAPVT